MRLRAPPSPERRHRRRTDPVDMRNKANNMPEALGMQIAEWEMMNGDRGSVESFHALHVLPGFHICAHRHSSFELAQDGVCGFNAIRSCETKPNLGEMGDLGRCPSRWCAVTPYGNQRLAASLRTRTIVRNKANGVSREALQVRDSECEARNEALTFLPSYLLPSTRLLCDPGALCGYRLCETKPNRAGGCCH